MCEPTDASGLHPKNCTCQIIIEPDLIPLLSFPLFLNRSANLKKRGIWLLAHSPCPANNTEDWEMEYLCTFWIFAFYNCFSKEQAGQSGARGAVTFLLLAERRQQNFNKVWWCLCSCYIYTLPPYLFVSWHIPCLHAEAGDLKAG